MEPQSFFLNITSPNPERLYAWYRDVIGLPVQEGMGDHALQLGGGATLGIDGHSETTGMAPQPSRWLPNVFVADVAAEEARIVANGVTCIRSQGKEEWGGIISTFVDPDGNYFQIVEYQPS
ncbi:MAG: VOC family protein [Dehalococcoidia bacterium]